MSLDIQVYRDLIDGRLSNEEVARLERAEVDRIVASINRQCAELRDQAEAERDEDDTAEYEWSGERRATKQLTK